MGEASEAIRASVPIAGPARPTSVRWHILALLLAFSFMSWFNRMSMPVAGDLGIMKQYSISPTRMGFVYSALLFTYTLCMIPGGWLADRKGAWIALLLMGLGSGIFEALTGYAGLAVGSIWLSLLAIRLLMGAFTAPIYPASGRIIAHWLPFYQRAWANGLVMGAALLGIAGAPVLFGILIDNVGWEASFVFAGQVTCLLALLWLLYAKDDPRKHRGVNAAEVALIRRDDHQAEALPSEGITKISLAVPRPAQGLKSLLTNRNLILLTLSYSAVGYFEYLFYFWMHYYFEDILHVGTQTSRYYASITFLAMAAGMFVGGGLSDWLQRRYGYRFGRAAVPVGGMLASAALLAAGIFVKEPAWIVTYFALALAAIGASEGPLWATAIDLGGKHGGTAAGIFNTGGNAGGILAPILTPWISQRFGWQWGIGVGGLYCLIGVVLWCWINPTERVRENAGSDTSFVSKDS
jgi:MFS family permease